MQKLPPTVLGFAAAAYVSLNWLRRRRTFRHHLAQAKLSLDIDSWGFKVFSQNDEDGIVNALAEQLNLKGAFVEFGFGIRENNCLPLLLERRMPGLFLDGSARTCKAAGTMFRLLGSSNVRAVNAWIDRDNVDELIRENTKGMTVDVLSVDVDGVDYWLLEAIHSITPAFVIAEYNASFGKTRSVTVAYDRAYDRMTRTSPLMHGMSLAAATKLMAKKGYKLIGCNSEGGNSFFVRSDLAGPYKTRTVEEAFRPLQRRLSKMSQSEQEAVALAEPLVEV